MNQRGCDPMKLHEARLEACQKLAKAHATSPMERPRLGRGFRSTDGHSNVEIPLTWQKKKMNTHNVGNVTEKKKDILSRHHRSHNLLGLTPLSPAWPAIHFGNVRIRSDSVSRQNTSVPPAYQH